MPDEAGITEAESLIGAAAGADRDGHDIPSDIEVPLGELLGARTRLKVIAQQLVNHFEKRRQAIEGKAMAVCMSRAICMDLYARYWIANLRATLIWKAIFTLPRWTHVT